MFSHHGIPETIISDNGPQYSSQKFADFASLYNFCHVTSSPHYPQSNGQAERAVQIVKKLLKASDDLYLALLTYCTTPLPWCNLSPAQLLMGHPLRSTLPQVEDQYKPQWQYLGSFKELNAKAQLNQKTAYDKGHRAQSLSPIPEVWITSGQSTTSGQIRSQAGTPRSYIVNTPQGQIRRNRCHLHVVPNESFTNDDGNISSKLWCWGRTTNQQWFATHYPVNDWNIHPSPWPITILNPKGGRCSDTLWQNLHMHTYDCNTRLFLDCVRDVIVNTFYHIITVATVPCKTKFPGRLCTLSINFVLSFSSRFYCSTYYSSSKVCTK